MRRGSSQPTSSSASRSRGTASREQTQRTRQGRNDAPVQADSISARRKSSNQPSLALPQQPNDLQPAPSGRRSPAYLEGKNPYGQILDNVDHPYRRPKATGGAPSQIGVTSESRPRTSGSFQFKTRPEPKAEPEREVTAPNPLPTPLPPRTPAKPVSVRAAKDFFESKASQNGSAPPLPPLRASAAAKGAVSRNAVREKQAPFIPDSRLKNEVSRSARMPSPSSRIGIRTESDVEPSMPRPPADASSQVEPAQRTNPFARPKSGPVAPKVVLRRATTPQDSHVCENASSSDPPEQKPGRRKSTNIFQTAPRDAKPLGYERRVVDDSSALDEASNALLIALEHANRSDDRHTSDETVRRRPTYESVSAAESDEGATGEPPVSHTQAQRTKSDRYVRKAFGDNTGYEAMRVPRRRSRSAPLSDERSSISVGTGSKSRKSSATDINPLPSSPLDGSADSVLEEVADIASNSFSHDGSSSTPSISRRSTAPGPMPQSAGHHVAVSDHVDWRGAYGRRITKDFGYPGARIKPRGTYRTYRPLQDPDHWTKRACGHFSYMANTESRDEASKKLCHQCATKSSPTVSQPGTQQWARRRAATHSSLSSSSGSSDKVDHACGRSTRRRQHHSECSPIDKCGDTFAKDLGYIIDAILEEHTNTLQGSTLRESIKTVPELVDLVNSAADDLGVDLDRRPRATDDETFRNAPVQSSSSASSVSQKTSPKVNEETILDQTEPAEDAWLEQTRRHLTELSEARSQLMDELDEIAEDLGVPAQEHRESEPGFDPVQRVLSKVSTGLSRKSTRLRNKSVDSVAEEIPRMIDQQINERRLSRVLTRISTQSRRMSAITQGLTNVGEIPREEIQEWLEVAQSELPTAIDSTTTVLETLPALEFEPGFEEVEKQPRYAQEFEYSQEPDVVYEDYTPPQRSYTEPLVELQDRVADLERLLRQQTVQLTSSEYEEGYSLAPLERAATSKTVDFEPPVERMAEQEPGEEIAFELEPEPEPSTFERTATRATTSVSRKPTNMSQAVENQSPFLSSSEL
ncbi:hypothetical protein E8E11_003273 [Didymella keratinophila]|nr:hypothetical protein E8E11_003273 [Didymella keratinophila]